MKLSDIKIASDIASKFLNTKDLSVKAVGHGSNNKNFLVQSEKQEVVIKLSFAQKEHRAFEDYKKEKWCIEKSSKRESQALKFLI